MATAEQDRLIALLSSPAPVRTAPLPDRELELLRYAENLTLAPASIREDDLGRLQAAGLDDRAIHDACAIVAYYAFVNRIADGLGVELEEPPGETAP